MTSRGLHADMDFLRTISPIIVYVSTLISCMRKQLGAPYSGSRHTHPNIARDSRTVAKACEAQQIFSKRIARRMQKVPVNTLIEGYKKMQSSSLKAFLAQHVSDTEGLVLSDLEELPEDLEDTTMDIAGIEPNPPSTSEMEAFFNSAGDDLCELELELD